MRAGHRYVGLIAMFSVLFLSFLWPPFCLHHLIFIAVAFQYILESENVSLFVPFQYFCCLSAPDSTWTKVGFPMSVEKASNLWMDSGIVSALTVARTGDFFPFYFGPIWVHFVFPASLFWLELRLDHVLGFFFFLSFKAKYMNSPHFVCLFLCLWTVGLFPLIGNCE